MEESVRNRLTVQRKTVSFILRITVAVMALGILFWQQSWNELIDVFSRLDWAFFVLALFVFAGSQVIVAFRWWILVKVQGISLGFFPAVKLHFLGLFYNNVMPSSVGGDLLRAWYVSKHTHKRIEAALSVFVDRIMGLSGVFLMGVFAYVFLMKGMDVHVQEVASTVQNTSENEIPLYILGLTLTLTVILCLIMGIRPLRIKSLNYLSFGLQKLVLLLTKTKQTLLIYYRKPLVLLFTLGLTLLLQSFTILAFWLLGKRLGITADIKYYFVIFPTTWVVGALPISIAGLGVVEGGIKFLFEHLAGVPGALAVCLAICQRFVWLLCSLPGGLIHLLGGHLPQTFSFDD